MAERLGIARVVDLLATPLDFPGRLLAVLAQARVPYMIVGSFASSYHARPRTTQDLDIAIDPTPASLGRLLDLLPEDACSVSREAARDALMRRSQFNVIDFATGVEDGAVAGDGRGGGGGGLQALMGRRRGDGAAPTGR